MSYRCLGETWPRARKEHRCIWCGQSICVGETHCHERSIYDGEFQNHRWHRECHEAGRDTANFEGGSFEFDPYTNNRGAVQ